MISKLNQIPSAAIQYNTKTKNKLQHTIGATLDNESTTPTGPGVLKLFLCSSQLSTKFQLLIKTKILTNKEVSYLSLLDNVLIMLINVKIH